MKRFSLLLGVAAAATFGAARAEQAANWYVSPMLTYAMVDKARCTDDGMGATIGVGRNEGRLMYEMEGHYLTMPFDCPAAQTNPKSGDASLTGLSVDVMYKFFEPETPLANVYGLFGMGGLKRKNMPRLPGESQNLFADLGVGYLYDGLKLMERDFGIRAEARYRMNTEHSGAQLGVPRQFFDVLFNVGVMIPFGATEAPPAPAEPVEVVPAAPAPEPVAVAPVEAEPATVAEPAPAEPAPPAEPTIETAKAGDKIVLKGVNFETAKDVLTVNAKTILDDVAAQLNARPEIKVEISGHTDSRGKKAYNQGLSDRRAQSVIRYLTEKGVAPDRMTGVGYGPDQPIDSNETDEGRERNRRVELKILE